MRIKIWGSRGSLPSFSPKYGGNTPCVSVTGAKNQSIIIDGGSGIRLLGNELLKGPCGKGEGIVHIFFTHFHWDHLIGLPFFAPLFIAGNQVHVYAVQPELKAVFETVFRKPYFPVPLDQLKAKIEYHRLEPRKRFDLLDFSIAPYQLDHPDPCWGYRIESEGKTYAHCVDTEAVRGSREALGLDLPLYQNIDLMLFDAQYTVREAVEKINWGHAAASFGLDIAMREGIKKVIFIHHDPAADDEKIDAAEHSTRMYYESQLRAAAKDNLPVHEVNWIFGHDGLEVEI